MKAKWTTVFAIFAISSALAIAFFIGLTVSTLIQSQYPLLFIVAIVVAFTAWFGRGTDILSLIREWHKERVEEEKRIKSIPKFIITHDEEAEMLEEKGQLNYQEWERRVQKNLHKQ